MNKLKHFLMSPIVLRVLTVGLNFVSNILINRSLGLELKGQYTTIINYAHFIQLFLNLGICYAYPLLRNEKGDEIAKDSIMTVIWNQTVGFLALSLILIFLAPSLKIILIALLSTVIICNNQVVFIALIDNIQKRNLFLLTSTILFIFLNVLAFLFFPGSLYVVVSLMIIKYVYEIIILSKSYSYFRFKRTLLTTELLKKLLKIGIPTAVLAVLISCNYNIDIFMLNWMGSGDRQVGIYGVAYSLANMLWILPDAFKELIYHKTAQDNNHKFVLKYIAVNIVFCICICVGFGILGKFFLKLIYGEPYVVAYQVTLTLFIGIIPMVAFKLIHPIYINKGKSYIVIFLLLIAVGANIISSWVLIPRHGAFGAAIASVISYMICGTLFFLKYYYDYCARRKSK
ncbi:MAG: oligosaccharide flippase family protein [Lachnospiraceae bacterium]|nr:oligosaccharide flippase family protein [Lachnospiraceae bacterium]